MSIEVEFSESGILSIQIGRQKGSVMSNPFHNRLAIFEPSDDDLKEIIEVCQGELERRTKPTCALEGCSGPAYGDYQGACSPAHAEKAFC